MSYQAVVIVANDIIKHPNADRLNVLRYNGEQFVIGKDISIGQIVVLFPTDGQLSPEFCSENNLYRDASKNKDKTKTGFFENEGRIRAQPFRGVKSSGFLATEEMFKYLGKVSLSAGDSFDELNGKKICNKYYTKKTLEAMRKNHFKKEKSVVYALKEHIDTEKWAYTKPVSIPNSLVIVTEKIHGTSARTGIVSVTRKALTFFEKLKALLKFEKFEKKTYEAVSGTRRTIVNDRLDVTTDGQTDFYRWKWHNQISSQLHKGETVYYEIVGFDSNGGTIMEIQNLSGLKDAKDRVLASWKNPMRYTYGLPDGQNDVYVYRITRALEDGTVTELSWFQLEQRCRELGLKTVPVLDIFSTDDVELVECCVEKYMTDSSSTLDTRHMMEGIVIRIENPEGTSFYKSKNWLFGILEGYLKENSDYVDNEEIN